MNLTPEHPSPALRAPSPLLGGGERDGVRGVPPSGSWSQCVAFRPWWLPLNLPTPSLISKDLQPGGSGAEIAEIWGSWILSPCSAKGEGADRLHAVGFNQIATVVGIRPSGSRRFRRSITVQPRPECRFRAPVRRLPPSGGGCLVASIGEGVSALPRQPEFLGTRGTPVRGARLPVGQFRVNP